MSGEDSVWAELMPPLRRFIRRHVRGGQDGEDLLQEVAVRIESHRHQMPPAGQRLPWALRITRNLIIDQRRASRLRQHAPLDADVESASAAASLPRVTELSQCLGAMIDEMPEPHGQVLRLTYLDGIDQQTLARRMNLSPSGARSRVQRARQQLHRMILDCCHIELDAQGGVVDYEPKQHRTTFCECAADTCDSARNPASSREVIRLQE